MKEAVEPSAGRLTEVETRHTGAAAAAAPGVESASRFALDEIGEKPVQRGLEYGLESSKDEVPTGSCVNDKGEVMRQKVLRESVALDAGERGQAANRSVGIRVHER